MKHLFILDLDNTLIFASGGDYLPAIVLLHYSGYTIYERPYARELVKKCHEKGDTVVFTTAIREYAERVCQKLELEPVKIFSREDCEVVNFKYVKSVPDHYFDQYDSITIIDDMPEVWDRKSHENCRLIGVSPFMGNDDDELLQVMNQHLLENKYRG